METELKFPVSDPAPLRRRIRQLGFRVAKSRRLEINDIWDNPAGALRRSGRLLRLRHSGERWILTVKGKRLPGPLKRRPEFETEVADGPACRALLDALGYRATLTYQRYRTTFESPAGPGELALDETPMGFFLEIEGAAPWIRRTAAALGLRVAEAEQLSYPELYARFRGKSS